MAETASAERAENHRRNAVGLDGAADAMAEGLGDDAPDAHGGLTGQAVLECAMAVEGEIVAAHSSAVAAEHWSSIPLPPLHAALQAAAYAAYR